MADGGFWICSGFDGWVLILWVCGYGFVGVGLWWLGFVGMGLWWLGFVGMGLPAWVCGGSVVALCSV